MRRWNRERGSGLKRGMREDNEMNASMTESVIKCELFVTQVVVEGGGGRRRGRGRNERRKERVKEIFENLLRMSRCAISALKINSALT